MPRRNDAEDGEITPEDDEYYGGKSWKKRTRSNDLIDDESEEDEEDSEDEYGDFRGGDRRRKAKKTSAEKYFDLEVEVDSDEETDDEVGDNTDPFINDDDVEVELPDDDNYVDDYNLFPRRSHRPLINRGDEDDDIDDYVRNLKKRWGEDREISDNNHEYGEEEEELDQQALLPSIRDPKLWKVKCAKGHEKKLAVCLMQKAIDKSGSDQQLQIGSVIALDNLKEYIYIEAAKEAHVKEACKGMRNIYASGTLVPVPIKEMAAVLTVKCKDLEISRGTWVRIKRGDFKGELAKVEDVDPLGKEVTLKLIPSKLKDPDDMMLKNDGFYHKVYSLKSISTENIKPTFEELYKFRELDDVADLSMRSLNRNKCKFFKGDRVVVFKGELKDLKGLVEKVEEDTVYIKPIDKGLGLQESIAFREKEICKYFVPGNHVKVVAGVAEGATGTVISVKEHVVNIVSENAEEELLPVFAGYLVETCEVVSTRRATQSREIDQQGRAPVVGLSIENNTTASHSSNYARFGAAPRPPPGRFSYDKNLVGARIKIRMGRHKGYTGMVKRVQGNKVWVEVDALTGEVLVNRNEISSIDTVNVTAPRFREEPRCGMTPMREVAAGGATPVRDNGMRTPMRDRAWNPYAGATPLRNPWEDCSPPPFLGY